MPKISDATVLILVCIVAVIALILLFKRNKDEHYGDAMHDVFIPFDRAGQDEMCKIILQDPDMKGSGLTQENCYNMPLTAFNKAMSRSYVCKKNMCGVVGSPTPDKKECVKGCKQAAYASSIYGSYGYGRD